MRGEVQSPCPRVVRARRDDEPVLLLVILRGRVRVRVGQVRIRGSRWGLGRELVLLAVARDVAEADERLGEDGERGAGVYVLRCVPISRTSIRIRVTGSRSRIRSCRGEGREAKVVFFGPVRRAWERGIVRREALAVRALHAQDEGAPEAVLVCEELAESLQELARLDLACAARAPPCAVAIVAAAADNTSLVQRNEGIAGLHPEVRQGLARLGRVGVEEE